MKSNIKSIRTSVSALLAVAFLAIGFNKAAAQVDPVSNHSRSETDVKGVQPALPCTFCADTGK